MKRKTPTPLLPSTKPPLKPSPTPAPTPSTHPPTPSSQLITPTDLASTLSSTLLLDLRPPLLFTFEHIPASVNHPHSTLTTSRFTKLHNLVQGALTKQMQVVILDNGSTSLHDTYSHAGSMVLRLGKDVKMLQGGFRAFAEEFPGFIEVDTGDHMRQLLKRKCGGKVAAWTEDVVESVKCATENASRVLPYVYVGSARNAGSLGMLEKMGITHVLVVGEELKRYHEGKFCYKQVYVRDLEEEDMEKEFKGVCEWLDGVREKSDEGAKVLIHCFAGSSRSVTCAVAYLVWLGYGLKVALELVKEKRRGAAPNRGFLKQLCSWETTCLSL